MRSEREISKAEDFYEPARAAGEAPSGRAIFVTLCVMLVFSVLAYGAVDVWALGALAVCAALVAVFWLYEAWKRQRLTYNASPLQLPLIGLVLIGLVQLLPLRDPGLAENLLSIPPAAALSLNPYATRLAVVLLVVDLIFFAAVLTFVNDRQRLKNLVLVVIVFSSLMAFFGILQRLSTTDTIYGTRPAFHSIPFASFFNQHHFAAFMEMTMGLTLGILFGRGAEKNMRVFLIIAAVIMGMAIIFTGSRGGLISLLAVLGFIVFANVLRNRNRTASELGETHFRRNLALVGGALTLIFILFGSVLLLGGDGALMRGVGLQTDASDPSNGRMHFWATALQIFYHYPILGAGLDAFGTAFSRFDTWNGSLRVEQAHNDYLQILADAGILGLLCVIAFIVLLFKKSLRTIADASDRFRRGTAVGALAGCFGVMVHSFFDFPLRTPSNALYFLTMAALATVAVRYPTRHRTRH